MYTQAHKNTHIYTHRQVYNLYVFEFISFTVILEIVMQNLGDWYNCVYPASKKRTSFLVYFLKNLAVKQWKTIMQNWNHNYFNWVLLNQ